MWLGSMLWKYAAIMGTQAVSSAWYGLPSASCARGSLMRSQLKMVGSFLYTLPFTAAQLSVLGLMRCHAGRN